MIHFDSLYLISLIFKYEAFQTNSLDYLCLPLERRFSTFSIFFEFSRIIRSSDRIRSFDWIRKLDCHDQDFRRIDDLDNRPRAKITSITKTFLPLGSKTIRTIISKIYICIKFTYQVTNLSYDVNDDVIKMTSHVNLRKSCVILTNEWNSTFAKASFLTVSDPLWPQLTSFWPYTKLHFRKNCLTCKIALNQCTR